jgi:hypothetical protein
MDPKYYRQIILDKIPEGSVQTRHTDEGHYYEIVPVGKTFRSVTGKLQILKDESLINYKANRALDYIFANYKSFTDENIMQHIDEASKVSGGILKDASTTGTSIHDCRQDYFNDWIKNDKKPDDILKYIPEWQVDVRVVSGLRALDKFITEKDYIPIVCEQYVYDDKFEVAGTLDDVGLMRVPKREGSPECQHEMFVDKKFVHRCLKCELKYRYELVLLDLKSSNQFKDHYFFQVSMYHMMFKKLTGLKPKRCLILKVSKEDGTYKIEELRNIGKLTRYAINMLKTNEALDFIRSIRKDNQKKVVSI